MNPKVLIAGLFLIAFCASSQGQRAGVAYPAPPAPATPSSRNLVVEVIGGRVRKKDTFSTDPYMSVSVCKQKERTPTVKNNLNPVWNWRHEFTDVKDSCRIKFHLYDDDIGSDDSIGEMETTVGKWIRERTEQSTLTLGKKGDSNIQVRVRYADPARRY